MKIGYLNYNERGHGYVYPCWLSHRPALDGSSVEVQVVEVLVGDRGFGECWATLADGRVIHVDVCGSGDYWDDIDAGSY
jgi:hypothetical protein